jgi:L-ascorbate metabolism protein UlaG (beta-lactamase superfamily)
VRAPAIRFADLPRIDLVLISHNHYDHLDLPTLDRLWRRDRPLIVTSLGNDTILRKRGIEARARDWGQSLSRVGGQWVDGEAAPLPDCAEGWRCGWPTVTVERVHHWGSRFGRDRNRALWSGFSVQLPSGSIFFAGDTGWAGGDWARAAARRGPYRLAIIPIGAYSPRGLMRDSHMNPEEAVDAFEALDARSALAVHWGTFQLTDEAIDEPPRRLAASLRRHGLDSARFRAPEPGVPWLVP